MGANTSKPFQIRVFFWRVLPPTLVEIRQTRDFFAHDFLHPWPRATRAHATRADATHRTCVYVYMCVYVHIYMLTARMYMFMCLYVYTYMYIYIYLYIYLYIYI